jgi:hypothetical protein
MAKEYFKELQEKIEKLEDGFDIKNLELGLLESEIQDTLKPTKLLNEQNHYLLEMLEQIIKFEKSKPSARVTASKQRLITLLGINTQLNQIMYYNQSLKLFNRELVTIIQLLRVENSDFKKQLKNISDANNF